MNMNQREIKFRAWDGEKMINNYLSFDKTPVGWIHGELYKMGVKVIQQYTGLKDKNGKEIYEGDIITDNSGKVCIQEWQNVKIIKEPTNVTINFHWCEVIGNIYENPELLN